MNDGRTLLASYLQEQGITQTEFAAASGVPQCQLSLYLGGSGRSPGRVNSQLIEKATNGRVPVNAWPMKHRAVRVKGRKAKHADKHA